MATANIISLLKEKGLRLTGGRLQILGVLHDAHVALSHAEIKNKLSLPLDRITTYRTLLSFKRKGLVLAIPDPQSGVTKYCLNKPELPLYHAHFKCKQCHALTCLPLDAEKMASISIPAEYVVHTYFFVLEGLCGRCKNRDPKRRHTNQVN